MGLHNVAIFFAEFMHGLKPLMNVPPKKVVRVQIVDDCQITVVGMRTLLAHWDNLAVSTFIQEGGMMPRLDFESDIILLDEDLDGLKGQRVVEYLRDKSFCGIIASIGQCESAPDGLKFHFNAKSRIGREVDATKTFIRFMNSLIEEVLRDRMEDPATGECHPRPVQLTMDIPPK